MSETLISTVPCSPRDNCAPAQNYVGIPVQEVVRNEVRFGISENSKDAIIRNLESTNQVLTKVSETAAHTAAMIAADGQKTRDLLVEQERRAADRRERELMQSELRLQLIKDRQVCCPCPKPPEG